MTSDVDLLNGIVAHPGEEERWLVLSDWYQDADDPRAELALLRYQLQTEPEHPQREQRLGRQMALLDQGPAPVAPVWVNSIGMPFALILPGTFLMGSPAGEASRIESEAHREVNLPQPFLLGCYPVTVGEYEQFASSANYRTDAERGHRATGYNRERGGMMPGRDFNWRTPGYAQTPDHPVVCVSERDAQAMMDWLHRRERHRDAVYSLPTQAQWEYACRAGAHTAYFWGDDPRRLSEFAWFRQNSDHAAHSVYTRRPNPWGLWHVHGLVWELCQGAWIDTGRVREDPTAPTWWDGPVTVVRGGCWYDEPRYCRAACRFLPTVKSTAGFRLAASLPGALNARFNRRAGERN